jgi:transcription-repair coupling factor (superfamily II helicase)
MALERISDILAEQSVFPQLREHLGNRETVRLEQMVGSLPELSVSILHEDYPRVLIVTPDAEAAQFAQSDLLARDLENVYLLPPTNHKPYDDDQVVDSSLLVQRSEVLEQVLNKESYVLVTSSEALVEKLPAPDLFSEASVLIEQGENYDPEKLKGQLLDQGYDSVRFVDRPGEFAMRGGILDVYPFSGEYPVRLEFFGDEVDSIREFDPDSQRSVSFLDQTRFVPNAAELGEDRISVLDILEDDTLIVKKNPGLIHANLEEFFEKAEKAYRQHLQDLEDDTDPQPEPTHLYLDATNFESALINHPTIIVGSFGSESVADATLRLNAKPQPEFNAQFKLLRQNIEELSTQGYDVFILCDNEGQRDRFEELLGEQGPNNRFHLSIETIHEGFILPQAGIAVYTDHQIFDRYHRPTVRKRRPKGGGISFKQLQDLNRGDYVVHVDYGIGKFMGFRKIKVRGVEQESVVLQYQESSTLYVNVSSLHKLQKYSGKEGTQPRMTKLGSGSWARKKAKTKKKVKDIARDLIQLYAKRKMKKAHAFEPDNSWQTEMEARFEYEETPDQASAIESVKEDMETDTPMDRLVCGDVGFGKTEVAVRAAFKAVMDGKQVGVLVPTTILADQHFKTFKKRMKHFPVQVEAISRFRSRSEQKDIIKRTEAGKVDILIGTHRITSKDIKFQDLGLVIIDEEQRFGVKAKERLKELRASVDVLTLTATPIPRTLQFSLMGARDLSIINTPPPNRQPVYTEIHSFNKDLIRDAILQEMSRGGQVFFIHNRVKNIESMADMVRSLVPDVRVRFAHGQMTGNQLEKIITDFYNHKFDVLVSTNIVENGIDISNANTMIINRADRFGLAELHQLRGRVGRSQRKAFCYLITPDIQSLTPEARKRLMALEEYSDLGSGFNIAMRDLDIRGAGDILGAEQSGFINDIGFELYTKILNDAVRELKEEEFKDVFGDVDTSNVLKADLPDTQVEFDKPALLGSDYVSDNVERLNLYRKLAKSTSLEEINDWKDEITDRFGPLPEAGHNLYVAAQIRLHASLNLVTAVRVRIGKMWLECPKQSSKLGEIFYEERFQPMLAQLEKYRPDQFKLIQKDDRVRFVIENIDTIEDAADFLEKITEDVEIAEVI